jgi:uncharacterized protein (TIGR03083 family)
MRASLPKRSEPAWQPWVIHPDDHLRNLRTHAAALLGAVRADPTRPVPSCPGWNRLQLLGHVGAGHSLVRTQLAAGRGEQKGFQDAERPPKGEEARFDWFEAGAAALADALAAIDPTETWPTWTGPQPGSWFHRRMAQETAMHHWDADPRPFDPDLAVDGIDELLGLIGVITNRLPAERFTDVSGTIQLHATGERLAEPGEWLVTFAGGRVTAAEGNAKGDAVLRGAASDLLLWAWNRVPADDRFDVAGNNELLRSWSELVVV